MSSTAAYSKYQYFLTSSPAPYVAHVQINRPTKLNAFKEAMWLELRSLFQQLSSDPDVRAVVLSGAGDKAFTAGLDVTEASQNGLLTPESNLDGARKAAKLRRHIQEFQECISAVEKCEKPVIAVMHGISIGLAIDIACCADVRLCAADTRFAVKEVDIGLAADIGTLARLPKVVGSFSWVKDIALSARDFSSEEALRVGFVSAVHESKDKAVEAAVKMAAFIGGKSPVAVQGTKEVLNHSRDHAVEDNLRYVGVWNAAALQTKDVQAALLSVMQKRKPTFEKL
ncbi:ClpP/crotonase-like domain-containing protein [Triangularia verruculosa]|uniref:ClpP/crotonase-like domain-containing protein n=1 Tax=Triangularia verruculosa TaxID=2587418 RepID=A0AAN7ASH3_9PEZI|nr:ClpP/crotonase-like domain-containing protein [Triangularia verruculosa]